MRYSDLLLLQQTGPLQLWDLSGVDLPFRVLGISPPVAKSWCRKRKEEIFKFIFTKVVLTLYFSF